MFKAIAWFSFLLAVAIAVFGGGAPIGGFKKNKHLYRQCKEEKEAGRKSSQDQQGAYYTVVCYKLSGWILLASLLFYILHLTFEG
jgi:hypothetical protein